MKLFKLASAIALCCHFSGFAQAVEKIPLDYFIKPNQFSHPRLAPDGKHIAMIVSLPDGERFIPTMAVFELPGFKMKSVIRLPKFEVPGDIKWLNNERLLVAKATERGSQEAPMWTGEILAFNLDGKKQDYLYGYNMFAQSSKGDRYDDDHGFGTIAFIPKNTNGQFFLEEHKWSNKHSTVLQINANNAARKTVADIPVPRLKFTFDQYGQPRYASGNNEKYVGILYKHNDKDNSWTEINSGSLGWGFRPFQFLQDNSAFYANYSEHGEPSKIVLQNTQNDDRQVIAENPQSELGYLEFDTLTQKIFAYSNIVGRPKHIYVDFGSEEAQLHQHLSKQFPDDMVTFLDFTEDRSRLLFKVSSDKDPGTYYLYDKASKKANILFVASEELEPEKMASRQPVSFKARDGLPLHGFLTMHPVKPGEKRALILLPHGGPHGVYNSWFFDAEAQFLANRGYAVLQVNFRGSGSRGKSFEIKGYKHWGDQIQYDLIDGVKWAATQPGIDGARVCAYGASFGAYASLMVTIREPNMFKCAVGYAGVYDLPLIFKEDSVTSNKTTKSAFVRFLGTDTENLKQNSPAYLAQEIKVPLFLAHGDEDKVSPVMQANAMRNALNSANKPYEWMLAKNEGHGFYATKNLKEFYERLEQFLAKHLGQ